MPIFCKGCWLVRRAISNNMPTPLAPSFAPCMGFWSWFLSLSAKGRVSQWAANRIRLVAIGLKLAMRL